MNFDKFKVTINKYPTISFVSLSFAIFLTRYLSNCAAKIPKLAGKIAKEIRL
jgi:hypothetical protein